MNLKYYLRGLGIGILVTAIMMSILSGGEKESLSDEEIIVRAKALGMIENVSLAEMVQLSPSPADDVVQQEEELIEAEEHVSALIEPSSTPTPSVVPSMAPSPSADAATSPSKAPETAGMGLPAEDTAVLAEGIEIEIKSGDGSFVVSKKLEAAGLVSSAADFDTFLCAQGYDKKLRVGKYTIPAETSEQKIADIITGKG